MEAGTAQLTMTVLMTPDMANFSGNVHGGTLLKYLDEVAYACASRYAGHYVVTLSVEDAEDLYASRAVLEPMAARHAARAITTEEVRELSSLHERMVACEIPARLREYRDLNRRFHEAIIAASRRPFLTRTLGHLWSAFPTMLWSNVPGIATTSSPEREDPDTAEHAEIVAALAAHDPERAAAAVKRHVEEAGRTLVAAMRAELAV